MTIYLQIRSDTGHSRSVTLEWLVLAIASWPQLQQRGADQTAFQVVRDGVPCASLQAFSCSSDGSYAIRRGAPPPERVNLLELWFAYEENVNSAWYEALAVRLAQLLGWEAWGEDDDGRKVLLCTADGSVPPAG